MYFAVLPQSLTRHSILLNDGALHLSYELRCKYGDEERYRKENQKLYRENEKLTHEVQDFRLVRRIFGDERVIDLINEARRADYEQRTARFRKPKRTIHKDKDVR